MSRKTLDNDPTDGNATTLQGVPLQSAPAPTDNYIMKYDQALNEWRYEPDGGSGADASAIQSIPVRALPTPTNNQVLTYNSGLGQWIYQTPSSDVNIYSTSGTLQSARFVDCNSLALEFINIDPTDGIQVKSGIGSLARLTVASGAGLSSTSIVTDTSGGCRLEHDTDIFLSKAPAGTTLAAYNLGVSTPLGLHGSRVNFDTPIVSRGLTAPLGSLFGVGNGTSYEPLAIGSNSQVLTVAGGTAQWAAAPTGTNIFNTSGTLTGTRVVDCANFKLTFNNLRDGLQIESNSIGAGNEARVILDSLGQIGVLQINDSGTIALHHGSIGVNPFLSSASDGQTITFGNFFTNNINAFSDTLTLRRPDAGNTNLLIEDAGSINILQFLVEDNPLAGVAAINFSGKALMVATKVGGVVKSINIGDPSTIDVVSVRSPILEFSNPKIRAATSGQHLLFNTWLGFESGVSSTCTNTQNTAVGYQALASCLNGGNNVGVGYRAGANTTGGNCVMVGVRAGQANTGSQITAVGASALLNSTGAQNTACGYTAGATCTTGTNNTFLGWTADLSAGANADTVVIGAYTTGGGSNCVTIGSNASALQNSVAVGAYANANGTSSVVIGRASDCNGLNNTISIGQGVAGAPTGPTVAGDVCLNARGTIAPAGSKLTFWGQTVSNSAWIGGGTTLAAINSNGDIFRASPVDSGTSYCEMYCTNNVAMTPIISAGVPVKAVWSPTYPGEKTSNWTVGSNRMTYTGFATKIFRLCSSISGITDGGAKNIFAMFYKDGVAITKSESWSKWEAVSKDANANPTFLISMSTNNYLELWIANNDDATDLCTTECNVSVSAVDVAIPLLGAAANFTDGASVIEESASAAPQPSQIPDPAAQQLAERIAKLEATNLKQNKLINKMNKMLKTLQSDNVDDLTEGR